MTPSHLFFKSMHYISFLNCIYFLCGWVHACERVSATAGVWRPKGDLASIRASSSTMWVLGIKQVVRLSSRWLHLLSRLTRSCIVYLLHIYTVPRYCPFEHSRTHTDRDRERIWMTFGWYGLIVFLLKKYFVLFIITYTFHNSIFYFNKHKTFFSSVLKKWI